MPRDNDKNNGRPPRRGAGGGKGRGGSGPREGGRPVRSAAPRGGKGVGARKPGDATFGGKRASDDRRPDRGPRKEFGAREERDGGARGGGRPFRPREDRGEESRGASRPFKPRSRDDRAPRGDARFFRKEGAGRGEGPAFGEKRPFARREDHRAAGSRGADRPFKARFSRDERSPRGDDARPRFKRDERPARDSAPRRDFSSGDERGGDRTFRSKPWQTRAPARDHAGQDASRRDDSRRFAPSREGAGERTRRFDAPREERGASERPRFSRPRSDRPQGERAPRHEGSRAWQEHPRRERPGERPRRDNEDDSKVFAKRPAFGGRGAYRERKPFDKSGADRRAPRPAAPAKKKTGERIAKIVSRAGLCSRRDAEVWITQGRVAVNGRVINSPALDITANDVVTIDGKRLPERERTRLFLYHKPRGLMTTHDDPEGRPTVFDNLPEGLPRLISVGRLDFNTEGLLLLTNDGGLARALELPETAWLRRYRVRAHGEVTQARLDELKQGVAIDGVKYGPIDAVLERDKGANVWIVFAIREGKNREVRNVMAHLGLEVNRLIRVSYGPFQLGEIEEGQVEEIKSRVLREQLGEKIVEKAGAQFDRPARGPAEGDAPAAKPQTKRGVIADRKGRRVLVQRTGSEEARLRNEEEAAGYGPPRRPKRGYKGKRDITPKDEQ